MTLKLIKALFYHYLSNAGFRAGSIKETAIIDDEIEEEEEVQESDNENESRGRSLSCEDFDKIMAYSEKVCNDLLRESTTTAAEESSPDDKAVTLDDIAQYSSVSEYSNFLLSKILNEAGLNGMSKDMENTFVMSRNSKNFLEMQGIDILADNCSSGSSSSRSSRTSEEVIPNSGSRASGISLASTLSAASDGSTDSDSLSVTPTVTVTDSGETYYKFPSTKEETSTTEVAAVHTSKPYRNNGVLESIQEVSDATENDHHTNGEDSDDSSLKSDRRKLYTDLESEGNDAKNGNINSTAIQCNGKMDSNRRTHPSVQATNSGASSTRSSKDSYYDPKFVCGRKESNASTQSVESNPDEDEERDSISEFKKREEKLASFGSSLRLNMGGKKVCTLFIQLMASGAY